METLIDGAVLVGVLSLVWKAWGAPYLAERARLDAQQQAGHDVEERREAGRLDAQRRGIRVVAEQQEMGRAGGSLRTAVLERRFEAHQQAWTLWWELVTADVTTAGAVGEAIMACQDWWSKNCLYLDPEPRDAFHRAYKAAGTHQQLLDQLRDQTRTPEDLESLEGSWAVAQRAGTVIAEAVGLPPLAGVDTEQEASA